MLAITEKDVQHWIDIVNKDKAGYTQEVKEFSWSLQPAREDGDGLSFPLSSSSVASSLHHERHQVGWNKYIMLLKEK